MYCLPRPFTDRNMLSGILLACAGEFTSQTAHGSIKTVAPTDAGVDAPLPLSRTRTLSMSVSLGKDKPVKLLAEAIAAQSIEQNFGTFRNCAATMCKPQKRRTELARVGAAQAKEQPLLRSFLKNAATECQPPLIQTEVTEDSASRSKDQCLGTFANSSATDCKLSKRQSEIAEVSAVQSIEQPLEAFKNSSVTEWHPRKRRTETAVVKAAKSGEQSLGSYGNSSLTEGKPRKRRPEIAEVSCAAQSREQSRGASANSRTTDYKPHKRQPEVRSSDYGGTKKSARNQNNWIEDIDTARFTASPCAVSGGFVNVPEFETVAKLISGGCFKGTNIFDRLNHVFIRSGLKLDVQFAMHPPQKHQSAAFECTVSSTGETLARTTALSKKKAKGLAFWLVWKKLAQVAQIQDAARLTMDGRMAKSDSSEVMRQVIAKCGFTVDVQPPEVASQSEEPPTFECVISSGIEVVGYGSSPNRQVAEHIALREAWNHLARFSKFDAAVKLIRTGKIIGPNSKDKLHQVFAKCGFTLDVLFKEIPGQKKQNALFECTVSSAGRTLGHASAGRKKLAKRLAFQQAWDNFAVATPNRRKNCYAGMPRGPSAIVERKRSGSSTVMQTSVSRKRIRLLSADGVLTRDLETLMAFQRLAHSCDIVSTMSATISNTLRGMLGCYCGESQNALGCSKTPSSDDRTQKIAEAKGSRKRAAKGSSPATTTIATKVCRKDTDHVEDRTITTALSPLASFSAVTRDSEHRSKFGPLAQQHRDGAIAGPETFANPQQQVFAKNSSNLDGLLEDMPPRPLLRSECRLCGDHVVQRQETVVNVVHTLYSTGGATGGECLGVPNVGMLKEKCRWQSLKKPGFPCLYSSCGVLGDVSSYCPCFCCGYNSTLSARSSRGLCPGPAAFFAGSLLHAFRWGRY